MSSNSSVGEHSETPRARVALFRDLIDELFDESEAAKRALDEGRSLGPPIAIPDLARELGGYWPVGMHVLHASPGAGKSAFAIASAADAKDCAAIYVSAEMRGLEVVRRLIARATSTFKSKLSPGRLAPSEMLDLARRTATTVPHVAIVDATKATYPVDGAGGLRETIGALRERLETPHALVVIDSIHSWAVGAVAGESEYEIISTAVAQLQALATDLQVAILVVAERNRFSAEHGGISAAAGSRKIEYAAETVLELRRSEDAVEDVLGEVPVDLKFLKNRNGRAGYVVHLKFHGAKMAFRQADPGEAVPISMARKRRA